MAEFILGRGENARGAEVRKACGRDCSAGNAWGTPAGECPAGFVCDLEAGQAQCRPTSSSCSCLADDADETRTCLHSSAVGTCFGSQTCDPASGWSECTALVPFAEVCGSGPSCGICLTKLL